MNKKLLLRRPKFELKIWSDEPDSSENKAMSTTKSVAEIRSEIEANFDQAEIELLEILDDAPLRPVKLEYIEPPNTVEKPKNGKVKLYDFDCGLLPFQEIELQNRRELNDDGGGFSTKTIEQFEKVFIPTNGRKKTLKKLNLLEQNSDSIPERPESVPRHLLLIQMAALLKHQLLLGESQLSEELSCAVRRLPPRLTLHGQKKGQHFELVLLDNGHNNVPAELLPQQLLEILQKNIDIIKTEADHSKNESQTNAVDVSPVQVSLMECHMTGQFCLDLQAHSIDSLPELGAIFPLLDRLDVSYNHFQNLPPEIFKLRHLQDCRIRNNPLQKISISIALLSHLRVLDCSFTLLNTLPSELFSETCLEELDASYCKIQCFPHVTKPTRITVLNLSGNPIKYFKKSFLDFPIEMLGLFDTWVKPIYWQEGVFSENIIDETWKVCDLCNQPIDEFLWNKISYGQKFDHVLPILVSFCTTLCRDAYS